MRSRGPRWSSIPTGIIAGVVVVVFVFVVLQRPPSQPVGQGANDYIGRSAPDFSLADLDGKTVRLSDLKGRVVVLDFWATWCPPCVAEMPHFAEIAAKYKDQGVVSYAVNVGETPAKVRTFLESKSISVPVLMDAGTNTAAAYGAQYIPLLVVIDATGRIVAHDNVAPDQAAATLTRWIESARDTGQAK